MADYYLQTSQVIACLKRDESDWLRRQLELVDVFDNEELSEGVLPAGRDNAAPDWSGYRFLRDYRETDDDPQSLGFNYQFDETDDSDWGAHLWIYCEENGDLGKIAHLVQKFLREFRPDDYWCLTYAATCSKPRVGDFGGGAVFVTAQRVRYQETWNWIERQAAAFQKHHRSQSARCRK